MLRKSAGLAGSVILLAAAFPLAAQESSLRLEVEEVAVKPEPSQVRLVTPEDGYLMLLHVADGGVRVMFPLKIGGSPALPAGHYTLDRLGIDMPWDNGRNAGMIVAAWSPTPIRTGEFVRYGHWAVSELSRRAFKEDPAGAAIELVTRLGATPGAVAAVEYGSIRTMAASRETSSRTYSRASGDDYSWKVIQNLIRIEGRANCPSGTRDVTGAGESCSRLSDQPRNFPRVAPSAEPAYVPPHPLQSPATARSAASSPPVTPSSPPPAAERRPSKGPL
jgi:hypothetical protein